MIYVDPNEATKFPAMKQFDSMNLRYKVSKKLIGIADFAVTGEKQRSDGELHQKQFLIERKTFFDFLKSLESRDNHLFQQLKALAKVKKLTKDVEVIPTLLLEGFPKQVTQSKWGKRWTDLRIQAAVDGVFAGWSPTIQFLRTTSAKKTVMTLGNINRNINKDSGDKVPMRITDPGPRHTTSDEAYSMIMGKKGVKGITAKKLMEEFGTVARVCVQSEEELQRVIGKKKGSDLFGVVNLWLSQEPEQGILPQ